MTQDERLYAMQAERDDMANENQRLRKINAELIAKLDAAAPVQSEAKPDVQTQTEKGLEGEFVETVWLNDCLIAYFENGLCMTNPAKVANNVREALAAAPQARDGWIPIETAPKNTRVLAFNRLSGAVQDLYFHEEEPIPGTWRYGSGPKIGEHAGWDWSHWMPRPAAPALSQWSRHE